MRRLQQPARDVTEEPASRCLLASATELKYAPLKDLCALGGRKSPQTVLTCYQRADAVSMQQALAARRRLEA
ncbi:MAG: hypothetical protein ACREOQ_17520 [Gemmatimonadales bacterium]